jgi:hypothetical protein
LLLRSLYNCARRYVSYNCARRYVSRYYLFCLSSSHLCLLRLCSFCFSALRSLHTVVLSLNRFALLARLLPSHSPLPHLTGSTAGVSLLLPPSQYLLPFLRSVVVVLVSTSAPYRLAKRRLSYDPFHAAILFAADSLRSLHQQRNSQHLFAADSLRSLHQQRNSVITTPERFGLLSFSDRRFVSQQCSATLALHWPDCTLSHLPSLVR